MKKNLRWIDLSLPLHEGMISWPGDPELRLSQIHSITDGDIDNHTAISMSVHTGTHIDAPRHFLKKGKGIDALPLDAVMGPARVIRITDPQEITASELKRHDPRAGERLLFLTRNSDELYRRKKFSGDFVALTSSAAAFLVSRRVQLVGIDYLSVGPLKQPEGTRTHETLLKGGIWIIEGLNLSGVVPGEYLLACLPLRLIGLDAAPARALLLRPQGEKRHARNK